MLSIVILVNYPWFNQSIKERCRFTPHSSARYSFLFIFILFFLQWTYNAAIKTYRPRLCLWRCWNVSSLRLVGSQRTRPGLSAIVRSGYVHCNVLNFALTIGRMLISGIKKRGCFRRAVVDPPGVGGNAIIVNVFLRFVTRHKNITKESTCQLYIANS